MNVTMTKPILRNDDGYLRPAGHSTSTEGYAASQGFGGEEWNHRPDLSVTLGSKRYKIFSLEAPDIIKAINNEKFSRDEKFDIYMTRGVGGSVPQEIIARAGNCTLIPHHPKKAAIFRKLEGFLAGAAGEAWELKKVRRKFGYDEDEFRRWWSSEGEGAYRPNWMCPYDDYQAFSMPVPIFAKKVLPDQEKNFVSRYNNHSWLDKRQIVALERYIGKFMNAESALADQQGTSSLEVKTPKEAVVQAVVATRRGQQAFRARIEKKWDGACAVTGSRIATMLRASHIVPWKDATHEEKFDPENGLLLCANHDALFDRGLISYAKDGSALVSDTIPDDEKNALKLDAPLRRKPGKRMRRYLEWHRKNRLGT